MAAGTEAGIDGCPNRNCSTAVSDGGLVHLAAVWDTAFIKVSKDDPAYAPIGVIDNGVTRTSAFLINDCYVLSTNHSMFGAGHDRISGQFSFFVGESSTRDFANGAFAVPVAVGNFSPYASTCEDFAVFRLNRCLGEQYGYVEVAPFTLAQVLQLQNASGKVVKTAGYPRTEGLGQISVDEGVVHGMHMLDPEAYGHTCGAMGGSSGGPLYFEVPGLDRLVAFGMIVGGTVIDGVIDDNTRLTGPNAQNPEFFNRAVPMECIYNRIRPYLPALPTTVAPPARDR